MENSILDLGTLAGPVAVFGGPYSNLAATEAMRQQAEALDIPPERVICTGDLVAYCAEPEQTVGLIRDWGIPVVMGNCEESLASGALDCGCGFEQGTRCDLLSVGWYRYASQRISAAGKDWMAGLPRQICFHLNGRSFAVVHGGVGQINRFVFASMDESVFVEEFSHTDAEVVIGGHCGLPFGRPVGQRSWLNAGVIGMPANEGTRDGWWMLLEPEGDAIRCRWQRLDYDAEESARRMVQAGLAGGYADALLSGRWPSLDILPETEKRAQGIRLELADLLI